jgi:hypothetical protein
LGRCGGQRRQKKLAAGIDGELRRSGRVVHDEAAAAGRRHRDVLCSRFDQEQRADNGSAQQTWAQCEDHFHIGDVQG